MRLSPPHRRQGARMGKAQGVPAAARPPPVAVLPLSISWWRYGDGVQRRDAMDLRRQLGATTTEMVSSSIGLCFPCSYGRVGARRHRGGPAGTGHWRHAGVAVPDCGGCLAPRWCRDRRENVTGEGVVPSRRASLGRGLIYIF
jgi:hypothetical protein